MNKYPIRCSRLGSVMIAICLTLSLGSMVTACGTHADDPAPLTQAPTEPVTLPDLTDDRTLTSADAYQARFDTAFSANSPVSSADLTYDITADGVIITGYTGGDVVVVLPDTIEDKPVVALGEGAFAGKGSLKALSIPDTVTSIEPGALEGCHALTTLRTPVCLGDGTLYFGSLFGADSYEINAAKVPDTLATLIVTRGETIPAYAFYDCTIEAISLPATITAIEDFAFYGNENLVYLPLGHTALREVGDRAFTNCAALLSLDIPATVNSLGFAMMEGCGKLETLTLPFVGEARTMHAKLYDASASGEEDGEQDEPVYTLGYLFGARSYMHTAGYLPAALIRVALHEGCGDLMANAFFECSSIREVILPEGVSYIGRRAFYGCEKLASMAIPDSVTTIGDDAFHGCIRLVDLTVGSGVSQLGVQVFMDCLSLRTVTLPVSVTYLPNAVFAGCRSLEILTAPGVISVGRQAFRHCDKLTGWDVIEPTID